MPIFLHKGDVVRSAMGKYCITTDDFRPGGQGYGYFVEDESGAKLFLKMFIEPTARSPEAGQFRVRQQALISKLSEVSDFVCRDIEFFESGSTFYKVSERMEGSSLQQQFEQAADNRDSEFWPQTDRQLNARVLAFAIAEIHDHGIAHLDLNPDNCHLAQRVIESTGEKRFVMRLLDFDSALVDGVPPPSRIMGTPNYWSPEHCQRDKYGAPGKHSDVFSLGIILYQLLVRRYPFVSERGFFSRATEHPRAVAPWLPDHVAEIIWRSLSPQPKSRPTAREIHQTLIRKEEPSKPLPPGKVREPIRVALIASGRRIRFWRDAILERDSLRGIPGYEYVDRYQARIFKDASGWVISALEGTANPTRLNGVALDTGKRYPLREGDIIAVGRFSVTVAFEYEE